jgi:C-terminal processing protease CtpA/Prc
LLAGKPVVILINRWTASSAELLACAIAQNGTDGAISIVGTGPTRAKGIGQVVNDLFDGALSIRVTRSHWFTPGGDWLGDCGQTVSNGIEPWVLVEDDRGPEGLAVANTELKKMLGRDVATVPA